MTLFSEPGAQANLSSGLRAAFERYVSEPSVAELTDEQVMEELTTAFIEAIIGLADVRAQFAGFAAIPSGPLHTRAAGKATEKEIVPGGPTVPFFHLDLVDDSGAVVDGRRAFRDLREGVHIKLKAQFLDQMPSRPQFGIIAKPVEGATPAGFVRFADADTTGRFITLPQEQFFELYEVD